MDRVMYLVGVGVELYTAVGLEEGIAVLLAVLLASDPVKVAPPDVAPLDVDSVVDTVDVVASPDVESVDVEYHHLEVQLKWVTLG